MWVYSNLSVANSEYMKNGDVKNLIIRNAQANRKVPNAVLWRVFICRQCALSSRMNIVSFC